MSRVQKIGFILIVFLQIASLCAMMGMRLHLLAEGMPVLLECEPIDPRSLFSGDYVVLNYKISALKMENQQRKWKSLNPRGIEFKEREAIYVALWKDGPKGFHEAVEVSDNLEDLRKRHKIIIRGIVANKYSMRIRYGVEHYFVPQYEGKNIENSMEKASVEAVVDESGESAIRSLFIAGKKVEFK